MTTRSLSVEAVDHDVDRKNVEAIEPMLRALEGLDWASELHARIVARLPDFGAALIAPVLAALSTADLELRDLYCGLLARLSTRDDRIFAAIGETWQRDMLVGAQLYVDYGDPRALPVMERALIAFEGSVDNALDGMKHRALLDAFRSLGGMLGDEAATAVERWLVTPAAAESHEAATDAAAVPRALPNVRTRSA